MGLLNESTIDAPVTDEAWECKQHFEPRPNTCSSCFAKQGLRGAELLNLQENNNLIILKQKIEEKKLQREKERAEILEVGSEIKHIFLPVSEVKEEATSLFKLERHIELCKRVDELYNNYLVSLEQLLENPTDENSNQIFQNVLRDLSLTYEDLVWEGLKVRWG